MYSHNDLLTTVIEDGFLGLFCILGLFAMIFVRFGRATLPVLVFFASGSLTDGALMERPVPFVLYWVAVAVAAANPLPTRYRTVRSASPTGSRSARSGRPLADYPRQRNLRELMLQSHLPPQRPQP